jgi:hypothetical protein
VRWRDQGHLTIIGASIGLVFCRRGYQDAENGKNIGSSGHPMSTANELFLIYPGGIPRIPSNQRVLITEMRFGATCIKKPFLIALRFAPTPSQAKPACVGDPGAVRKPAAQGKRLFFLYPAFTSQRVRKTASTLARHAGLFSAAPFGTPQGRLFGAGSRSLEDGSHS